MPKRLTTPLDDRSVRDLRAGEKVLISGPMFTARDAAHKRLCELLERRETLPVDFEGQIIYYTGPTPPRPGAVIGSAGPTTSVRMDAYSPALIRQTGLKGMIGKGNRSEAVVDAMKRKSCVYFAAVGGAGALIAQCIQAAEVVCYDDLGPEAVRLLQVKDFPAVVAIDCLGNNLYETGPEAYRDLP